MNFVFGNFLLSRYERDEKNYEKELDYLNKAHNHFFELKKEIRILKRYRRNYQQLST